LSDFASVKAFATKCEAELDRLDVFLSNAGLMSGPWQTTKDGWEVG
jgi:retinol dehydrogenase 12